MSDVWADLAAKTNLSANDLATAINTLMANERLMKGGTASVTPSTTIEALAANVAANVVTDTYEADTSSAVTLVYTDGNKTFNPTVDHDINLPKTSVGQGYKRTYTNRSLTKVLTVKATNSTPGDGGTVCIILPLGWVTFQARQATPTANTHWRQVDAGGGWADVTPTYYNMGTCTNTMFKCRRNGPNFEATLKVTVGTTAADLAAIGLPFSLEYPHTPASPVSASGNIISTLGAAVYRQVLMMDASTSYTRIFIGYADATTAPLVPRNASGLFSSGDIFSADFSVPIVGWEVGV